MGATAGGKARIIRVPFALGCGRLGTEHGPESIMAAGLRARLRRGAASVEEEVASADVLHGVMPETDARVKRLSEVKRMSRLVAERVAIAARSGEYPLVLGGDHSVAIGSLAGLTARYPRLGVIWLDAHADLNTEQTTPSGNAHGIPLAVALGLGDFKLTELTGAALLRPERLVLIAARDVDPGEREAIRALGIACFTMEDIGRMGMEAVARRAAAIAGADTDGIHLSLDLDAVDPAEAPGVGTPVAGGISAAEAKLAARTLAATGKLVSADVVEVNPELDAADGRTAKLAAELAATLLGQ